MSEETIAPTPEVPPVAPEVQVLPNTTEDKTVNLSQSKLDSIVKDAMSRAGRLAREEAEKLRVENERLKTVVSGTGSADELERTKGLLAEERLKNQAVLDASVKQQRDLIIAQESNKHGFVDTETLQKLTRSNLKHDVATGSFVVVNDDGTPKVGPDGTTPVTVSDFFQDFGNKKPWLVKGTVITGTGQGGSTGSQPPPTKPLSFYFGPQSSAAAVNALSLRDPATYRRLRSEAIRAGLIGGN